MKARGLPLASNFQIKNNGFAHIERNCPGPQGAAFVFAFAQYVHRLMAEYGW
jgi:hypothetical protein